MKKEFWFALLFILSFVSCQKAQEGVQNDVSYIPLEQIKVEEMTPEQVLDKYISYFNYKGISDRLNKISLEKQLASGILLESLEVEETYLTKRLSLNSDWIKTCNEAKKTCNEAKTTFKKDLSKTDCGNVIQDLDRGNNIRREFEVLSKEIIEESDNIVKIKTKHKTTFDNTFQINETIGESVYILKKRDDSWKVYDKSDEKGKLFSEVANLDKRKEDSEKSIQEEMDFFQKIKDIVDGYRDIVDKAIQEQQKLNQFKQQLFNVINEILYSERIISIDLGNYNNQKDKYVISITYYFEDVWLADNYLQVMSDASDIFKAVFPVNPKIYQVQTTVKEKYKDDYGNTQERYLARISMNRETYNKINWKEFESSKLDKIAYVAFYGDSFYKDLKDLGDRSKQWQNVPSGGYPMIEGAPASLCDDAKEQCSIYGECDTYEMLKSQGICR